MVSPSFVSLTKRSILFAYEFLMPKLSNYLRAHRKKSGLSEHEVASIVGWKNGGVVSHYEWGNHLPSLRTALALETLFQIPVSQLFAGIHEAIGSETEKQLRNLQIGLENTTAKGPAAVVTAKKLVWLTERRSSSLEELT